MATLDEVKRMQQEGQSEDQIINNLRERGISYKDISEALSQSQIKAAVVEPSSDPNQVAFQLPQSPQLVTNKNPQSQQLSPSMKTNQNQETQFLPGAPESQESAKPPLPYLVPQNQQLPQIQQANLSPLPPIPEIQAPAPSFSQTEEYPPYQDEYQDTGTDQYQYDDYGDGGGEYEYDYSDSGGISADTISEISEQVVSEKMLEIRKHLEKVIDFKTVLDAKTDSIDERLKRIEKIIATLQSSVLRKVGDYVTNVDDIKKELVETQKSFSKLASAKRTTTPKKRTRKTSKK